MNIQENIHELPSKGGISTPFKETKARNFEVVGSFTCTFCSGKNCSYENYKNFPDSVIKGLSSHYITPNIIASQRPSNRLIEEFHLIEKFQEYVSLTLDIT